ncbi:hypothetical protein LCGC14_0397180 [marine sediment metagenome]|uniref:Uncharacterized protein n=1 Tax=marine sediment metagenome TaxID=412755 RepID=A0A0F9SY03_9ZZZZ
MRHITLRRGEELSIEYTHLAGGGPPLVIDPVVETEWCLKHKANRYHNEMPSLDEPDYLRGRGRPLCLIAYGDGIQGRGYECDILKAFVVLRRADD